MKPRNLGVCIQPWEHKTCHNYTASLHENALCGRCCNGGSLGAANKALRTAKYNKKRGLNTSYGKFGK